MTTVLRMLILGSAAALCAAEPLHAQCASAESRQFEFVVGNWLVRDASGHAIGTLTVSHEYGNCVLIERWKGMANSGEGLGVIGWQPEKKTWHREFIDSRGFVVAFDGELRGHVMVMDGKDYPSDAVRMNRVSWIPRRDGSVEERWRISTDGGRSWQDHFYGLLERIAE